MASKVQIVNMALVQLGQPTILNLTDNTANAKRANALYDLVRQMVLQAHPWNGSTKQAVLTLLATTPDFKWTYRFSLPADCLRALRTDQDVGNKRDWQQYGGEIWTDHGTLELEYIYDNEDTTLFSPGFVMALSSRLEAELTYPVTGSTTLADAKLKIYDDLKLPEAKALDAQVGGAQKQDDLNDSWEQSRNA